MFQSYGFQPSMFGATTSAGKRPSASGGMRTAKKPSAMASMKAKGKHKAIFQTRAPRNESEVSAILAGNKFLNDEHKALLRAYSKKNFKAMQPVLKKLARMRDRLRKESIAAADGKSARQIAGRGYLGVMTLGTSELVRLLSKKKISQARLKRAEVLLAKATAAEKLMNYWTAKIKGDVKKGAIKLSPTEATAAIKQVDTLNTVGSTAQEVDTLSADEQATQAAAVAEVEAEAPVAEVQAAAATENAAQVTAPIATESEAAALKAEAESAPEPELAPATETLTAAAPAAAAAEEDTEEETTTVAAPPRGMSMNMKLGLGAAALAVLLLATRR